MTAAIQLRLSSDFEVGAAASIHPDPVPVAPPGAPKNAGRLAVLANQADISARAFSAIMAPEVARLAIEGLNETVAVTASIIVTAAATASIIVAAVIAVAIIRAGHEVGAATSIHPDAAAVVAPRPPRNTWRVAVLAHESDAAARISAAKITPPIVRFAT
jgi:hypothetical protein